MRITFLINNMGFGGAEIQVADLAKALARRGHEVSLVVLMTFLDFEEDLRQAGIRVLSLGMGKGRPTALGMLQFVQFLRHTRPDVLHAHLTGATLVARLARSLAPLPVVVCTGHSTFERDSWRYWAHRLTDRWGDMWTNVCQEGLETYIAHRAVPSRKARRSRNGIDTTRFTIPTEDVRNRLRAEYGMTVFSWLSVGSFRDEAKDYNNLLHAFARTSTTRKCELFIAGVGRLRVEKEALARRLGIHDRVHFLGLRSDVPKLMQAADAFVLASSFEALPIVLLEAAATGLPAVVTRVGGNPEAVVDHATGLVVPPKDSHALASAMDELMLFTEERRLEMGIRARKHVQETFDLHGVVADWEALYGTLLAGDPRAARTPAQ